MTNGKKQILSWEQKYFQLIVENSTDLIAVVDSVGKFLYTSSSHKKILGYDPKELIGKDSFIYIHPKDKEQTTLGFQQVMRHEPPQLLGFTAIHKDGHEIFLESIAASYINSKNEPPVFIAIFRDASKKTELELKKDEFISVAHHELKSPLTSIFVFAELLQKECQENFPPKVKKYLEGLNIGLAKLRSLVDELALYSEFQMGRVQLKTSPVQIGPFIKKTIKNWPSIDRNILVQNHLDSEVVMIDKTLIKFITSQIIDNAIKYSPENTDIIVKTTKNNHHIRVEIEDFGDGIHETERLNVRRKYYQIGNPLIYTDPGFGLGLFLASEIMRLHGGILELENKKTGGSIITLQFKRI
jgi:two-component system, chemotaxis family, CheB/CheR fusion protein